MRHFCGYRHHQVSTTTTSTWMTLKVSAIYLTFQTWTFLLHCLELWPLPNHPIYQPSLLNKLVTTRQMCVSTIIFCYGVLECLDASCFLHY